MNPSRPIQVGDILDTQNFGSVQVIDLFVSPRTNKIVYEVYNKEDSSRAVVTTDELVLNKSPL